MDAVRDVEAIRRLAGGFPLELRDVPGAGLQWEASRHICVGELVLRSEAYAAIVSHDQSATVCHTCLRPIARPQLSTAIRCVGCGKATWCSERCRNVSRERLEVSHGEDECRAFRSLARAAKPVNARLRASGGRQLTSNELSECRLVVRILARRLRELQRPGAAAAAGHTFADVVCLVSNREEFRSQRPRVYERLELKASLVASALAGSPLLRGLGADDVLGLLCREKCNTFGLWSPSSTMRGVGLYPVASYFNHSCAPNAVHHARGTALEIRALAPIARGEPVAVSYIELADDSAEHRAGTLWNFCFACGCPRCTAQGPQQEDALWRQVARFCCRKKTCVGTLGLVRGGQGEPAALECNLCGARFCPTQEETLCSCGNNAM
eukprot:m51a1_g1128 hypothetical protein (382) ;mRNA; f:196283-197510